MMFALWVSLVAAGCSVAFLLLVYLPRRRLRRALAHPFPAAWQDALQHLPHYARLPPALRDVLRHKIKAFLHQKRFVGCDGLIVTDEMRVLIAAQACLLLLNRPSSGYHKLRWIYLYPGDFRSRTPERDAAGVVSHATGTLAGVSWDNGRVVLAWESVRRGLAREDDGYNVVLHEFAHQLDQEDGFADGVPLLYRQEDYGTWSQVFNDEFERLVDAVAAGEDSLIDPYGATNAAEFFAVVTELFYERPVELSQFSPTLYDAMAAYYRVDPRQWHT